MLKKEKNEKDIFLQDDGLTETGFLHLHTNFIWQGRPETTWTVLQKFGYGSDLRLTEEFLVPKFVVLSLFSPRRHPDRVFLVRFDVPYDCSVELSPPGYQFFTDLFETFDKVHRFCATSYIILNIL